MPHAAAPAAAGAIVSKYYSIEAQQRNADHAAAFSEAAGNFCHELVLSTS